MLNKFFLTLLLLMLCASCGKSSHKDDFVGAANVTINASPKRIDTGDRTRVKLTISDVHEDGILLKIYYPSAFTYVNYSAYLKVNDMEYDIDPNVDVAAGESVKSGHYLVFFFAKSDFGEKNYGELTLELVGSYSVKDGTIGVDPDVNDLEIPDKDEFNPFDPQYQAEATVVVSVTE